MKNVYFKSKSIIFLTILFILMFVLMSCAEDDCWICSNGKCYNCNGKGYIHVDSNICNVCKGTGICFNCDGTGKMKTK